MAAMILAIINHKGGAGKTTTTLNVGVALARKNKRVLMIDFDAQGSLTYSMGVEDHVVNVGHALLGQVAADKAVIKRGNLHLLPGGSSLVQAELFMARSDDPSSHLQHLLQGFAEYGFILIDCAPSLSLLSANALQAASHVLVPMQLDVLALKGLDSLLKSITEIDEDIRPEVLGILPVMVSGRRNLEDEIVAHIKDTYNVHVFDTHIRNSVKAAEAPSFGKSVIDYAPSSTGAQDYLAFTNEFLKINEVTTLTH